MSTFESVKVLIPTPTEEQKEVTYTDPITHEEKTQTITVTVMKDKEFDAMQASLPEAIKQCEKTPVQVYESYEYLDKDSITQTAQKLVYLTVKETVDGKEVDRIVKWSELKGIEQDVEKEGRWGLGCPWNCGRFWEFKPTNDLKKFIPTDKCAYEGKDLEGKPTKGYLNYDLVKDIFYCDRCNKIVKLAKGKVI